MADTPDDDFTGFADYLELARSRPDRFVNPAGRVYQILFDRAGVQRAQADARRLRAARGLPCDDLRVGVLAHDPYLTLLREAVRFPDGSYGLYNRLLVPFGVAMLPVIGERIVLLHRFRHGTRRWHLEIPRGCADGEDDFAGDARRELEEEIGAAGIELEDLGMLHSSTGCLDETYQLFLARIASVGAADVHEAIGELRLVTVEELQSLIASGELTDGPTLACFLRARLRGLL